MNFTICNAPQRSAEWFAARVGIATGSRASDIVAKIKSGEAAARRDYRSQLVAERLTGQPQEDTYINADMERGIALEADARMAYEAATGTVVHETGFLRSTTIEAGCSLDGHVDDFAGIIEIKCPRVARHIEYLRANRLPPQYIPQVTHNLLITGARWCDFISYCPQLPPNLALFVVRAQIGDGDLTVYSDRLREFLTEVDAEYQELLNFQKGTH